MDPRRRLALGRPDTALLPGPAPGPEAGRGLCEPDRRLGLQGECVRRGHDLRPRRPRERRRRGEVEREDPRRVLPFAGCRERVPGVQRFAPRRGHERRRGLRRPADDRGGRARREPEARLGLRDLDPGRAGEGRRRPPDLPDHVQSVRGRRRELGRPDRDQRRGRGRRAPSSATTTRRRTRSSGRTGRSTSRSPTTTSSKAVGRS